MARSPAVNQGVVLPNPPEKYDAINERETRRLIEEALRRLLDWGTVTNVPGNVDALAGLDGAGGNGLPYFSGSATMTVTTLTAFGRLVLAAADAQAGRVVLGMGALGQRANVTITTASLASGSAELSNAALPAKSAALLVIAADRACRVRLYATQAARDSDASRSAVVKGTPGTGLLAEFVFTGAGSIPVSPVATLSNDEATPQARVWYNIENSSGVASTVAVTLTVLPLEI